MSRARPLIGIPTDRRMLGQHPFHCVGEKYINAVASGADTIPILIPSLGALSAVEFGALLERLDGIVLTGSPSNVEPHHYQGPSSEAGTLHDPHRDATTLPLIPQSIATGMPVLGICRGFQEINVAFGGSLHQRLHSEGFNDHREDKDASLDEQYGPSHDVELTPGGLFASWAGNNRIRVNSLHSQGVNRLGKGLLVEARSPDGVIEAFRATDVPFCVAVQWHPEWRFESNEFSKKLFAAFGAAAREYSLKKQRRV